MKPALCSATLRAGEFTTVQIERYNIFTLNSSICIQFLSRLQVLFVKRHKRPVLKVSGNATLATNVLILISCVTVYTIALIIRMKQINIVRYVINQKGNKTRHWIYRFLKFLINFCQ